MCIRDSNYTIGKLFLKSKHKIVVDRPDPLIRKARLIVARSKGKLKRINCLIKEQTAWRSKKRRPRGKSQNSDSVKQDLLERILSMNLPLGNQIEMDSKQNSDDEQKRGSEIFSSPPLDERRNSLELGENYKEDSRKRMNNKFQIKRRGSKLEMHLSYKSVKKQNEKSRGGKSRFRYRDHIEEERD
eukprot:TRINITY_DN22927_c0_g1_i1.p1 TRINITY_DN22927_c0_g1~~TRINITY_DN22927_c0_g1_i1.p1  ORF type:complete len:205 (-),score=36.61 TRINITY_DN22927_c0_g1_i1:139-696(-)